MNEDAAAPARRIERKPRARTPHIRIEDDDAAGRDDARCLAQKRLDIRKVKEHAQRNHGVKTRVGKGERERVSLRQRQMTLPLHFRQHRARSVQTDSASALRENLGQPPSAASQIERALKRRQERKHEFDLARIDPRATRAAKAQFVIIARDLGLGVKRALGVR